MNDLVATIRTARDAPTTPNLEAMWKRVFEIPAWYLLPAALDAPTTPFIAVVDGGHWLAAFTHFRTLNEFARERGMRATNGEVPMLALSPRAVCERVAEVTEHVDGIVFNLGTDLVFRAPVEVLAEIAARFID